MKGKKFIESTSHVEILDLLRSSGPLTIGQIDRIRGKTRSDYSVRWLHTNGYVGVLPTNPVQFVAGSKELPPPTYTNAMRQVLAALEQCGPCTSAVVAEKIDRANGHVDAYFRAARDAGLIHRVGEVRSGEGSGAYAYTWVVGGGVDYVRPARAPRKARPKVVRKVCEEMPQQPTRVIVRRDPLVAALFGAAA